MPAFGVSLQEEKKKKTLLQLNFLLQKTSIVTKIFGNFLSC